MHSISLLVLAFTAMSSATIVHAEEEPTFPLDVSCLLSIAPAPETGAPQIEEMARSCNDFSVGNRFELGFVTRFCKMGASAQRWIHKVVPSKCDETTAYSICRVPEVKKPSEFISTYYYLSNQNSNHETETRNFEASCQKMAGEYSLLNQ